MTPPRPVLAVTGRRLWRCIGRRGTTLLFLATLDIIYAASLAKPPAEAARSATIIYITHVAPLGVWAALWGAVGLVCLAGAFTRRDRWAFTAAIGLKVLWGTVFLAGWAINGLDRGWVSAVIWLAFALLVYVIAGWPEQPETVPVGQDEQDEP